MGNFTPSEFWKNFQLGTELCISGNFIYNGIYCFDMMEHFCYEAETFEFLYNTAVGIERLQKITLILLEHTDDIDQNDFEKNLITHNHNDLHARIKKHRAVNFGKQHLEFLNLLSTFYKSARYERYNLDSIYKFIEGRNELVRFIEKFLKIDISVEHFRCSPNSDKIKKFIGNVIEKITSSYFALVTDESYRLNIYTTELPTDSKAMKIFWGKKSNFIEDRLVQKEIIKYLIQAKLPKGFKDFLDSQPPLELGFYNTNYYIDYLLNFHKKGGVKEELDELYLDIKKIAKRINHLKLLGDEDIDFEPDEDIDFK